MGPGSKASAVMTTYAAAQAKITARLIAVQASLRGLETSAIPVCLAYRDPESIIRQHRKLQAEERALKACDYYHKNFMKMMISDIKGYEYIGNPALQGPLNAIINLTYPPGATPGIPYKSMHQHTFGPHTSTEWDSTYAKITSELGAKEAEYNQLTKVCINTFAGKNNATIKKIREVKEMVDILRACKRFHTHIKDYVRNYYYTTTATLVPLFAPCGTLVIP
jgi:hypothetical protein